MDDENLLAKSAPPSFLKKLLGFFKRLIRFMFCLEKDFINDVNFFSKFISIYFF